MTFSGSSSAFWCELVTKLIGRQKLYDFLGGERTMKRLLVLAS